MMQEIGKKDFQTVEQSLELPARMKGCLKPMLPIRGVPHSVGIGSALVPLLNTGMESGNQQLGPSVSFVPCRGVSQWQHHFTFLNSQQVLHCLLIF